MAGMRVAEQVWGTSKWHSARHRAGMDACVCTYLHQLTAGCMGQVILKKANVNREEVSTMVKDKINEFAMRGFRALGVSVADGDQTGPDECAPAHVQLGLA